MNMSNLDFFFFFPEASDCTASYDVKLKKNMTVKEFIDEVLTRGEWGDIYIYDPDDRHNFYRRRDCNCNYIRNKVKYDFPGDILGKTILSIAGHGGWSRMDYVLTLEE